MGRFTLACAALIGLVTAGTVCAQETDEAAVRLRDQFRTGDRVTLSLKDMVIEGKLLAIEPDALRVQTAKGMSLVPFAAVDEASRKRMGTLLGLVIGTGAGAAWGLMFAVAGGATADDGVTSIVLCWTGVGAAVGVGIDSVLNRNRLSPQRQVARVTFAGPRAARRGYARLDDLVVSVVARRLGTD